MSDETRIKLDSWDANRDAALSVARCARRQLNLLTYDLEPQVYNEESFIEAVTAVATSGRYARVRVMVQDSRRAVREGHRLIELARRLSSFISVHRPHAADAKIIETYLLADEIALLYRTQADRYEGFAETDDPFETRQRLREFEDIWGRSSPDPEMRRLGI
jgi:hypothetical protein